MPTRNPFKSEFEYCRKFFFLSAKNVRINKNTLLLVADGTEGGQSKKIFLKGSRKKYIYILNGSARGGGAIKKTYFGTLKKSTANIKLEEGEGDKALMTMPLRK